MKSYSDQTYNSKNPLARFSHRRRFKISTGLLIKQDFKNVLDYGAGDLAYLNSFTPNQVKDKSLFAYEPVMVVEENENIQLFINRNDLYSYKFDVITCFEVLEHFNEKGQLDILSDFSRLLNCDGKLIISVPVEIGLPSLVKNARRFFNGNMNITYLKNSIRSFLAKEVPSVRNKNGYLPTHIGFNHKRLEKLFMKCNFIIEEKHNSPLKTFPSSFNSQVFYVLKSN